MLIAAVPGVAPPPRETRTGPIVLATEGLSKTYARGGWLKRRGDVAAAADVTLEIRRGETLGIVGESGSGKSTVARCIARLIEPSAGRIVLDGEDIARLSADALRPRRRRVQIVFQDPYRSLNPRRTVGDAIIEGPMNYGATRGDALKTASELMGLVRLDARALDRYPHQFSGGQRQRICIARALAIGARAADRRRSGVRARRVGAGAGAGAARRDPAAARPRDAVHHARSARRGARLRSSRGDAAGAHRRAGAGRRSVRRAAARVHESAVRRRSRQALVVRQRRSTADA